MSVFFLKRGQAPALDKRASDYAVGDIVKLRENGVPVEYLVVHQGLPGTMYDASCDGCWILRKVLLSKILWNSTDVNDYANSTINAYLNGEWLNRFDVVTKAAIKQVKIPFVSGTGGGPILSGAKGLSCYGFLLCGAECGLPLGTPLQNLPADGEKLLYFDFGDNTQANSKRIAKVEDGSSTIWVLRTACTGWDNMVGCVNSAGGLTYGRAFYMDKIRPTHILRSDTLFDSNNILKG